MKRAVVALVALFAAVVQPLAGAATAADSTAESSFFALINEERMSRGLAALTVREEVVGIARSWSDHMAGQNALSHNPHLGTQMPSDWLRIGENVGMGYDVQSLHAAFMNSTGHRANILGDFNQVGVGVSYGDGRMFVTVDFMKTSTPVVSAPTTAAGNAPGACGPNLNPVSAPSGAAAAGYWVLGSDGGVFSYGNAPFLGSVPALGLRATSVLMAATPSQRGYWVLGDDGGIFSFGDARFHGSLPGVGVRNTSISMASTPTGNGYWILGADGGIFNFGDAGFFGSVPGLGLCESVTGVQLAPSATGRGYYVLSDRGAVFAFGDALHHGEPKALGVTSRDLGVVRP